MRGAFDDILEESDGPRSVDVRLPGDQVIGGVSRSIPDGEPRRYALEPSELPAELALKQSRPIASADAGFRPSPATPGGGDNGFDWARALTVLSGGDVGAIDAKRANEARLRLEQERDRRAQDDANFERGERAKKLEQMRRVSDPGSEESRAMRQELEMGFSALGESMPQMKPTLAMFSSRIGSMSAADMMGMQERFGKVIDLARKAGHDKAMEAIAEQQSGQVARKTDASIDDIANDNSLGWAKYKQDKEEFDAKQTATAEKAKANQIRAQIKSVNTKDVNELQDIESMEGMLKEAESAIPNAMTGPGTGAMLATQAIANSSLGKAFGADAVFDAVTPQGTKAKLDASRTVQSNIEQAIAEMKLKRHGASFTSGEQDIVNRWAPNVKFSPAENALLISALRRYMAYRAQQKLQAVYKQTGMPIYLPPDKNLSLDDARKLKAEFEGINQYDDDEVATVKDRVNAILKPYGGQVASERNKSGTASPVDLAPKPWPGAQAGQRKRDGKTGITWEMQADGKLKQVQ